MVILLSSHSRLFFSVVTCKRSPKKTFTHYIYYIVIHFALNLFHSSFKRTFLLKYLRFREQIYLHMFLYYLSFCLYRLNSSNSIKAQFSICCNFNAIVIPITAFYIVVYNQNTILSDFQYHAFLLFWIWYSFIQYLLSTFQIIKHLCQML